MQQEDGRLKLIDVKTFNSLLNVSPENTVPVVKVGDTFKIRDCHFEVTDVNVGGIVAKGIRRGEFIKKHFGS